MYDETFDLREMALSLGSEREAVARLLTACGLAADSLPPYYIGVCDEAGRLVAGGGLDGDVIKCVAVSEGLRGESLLNRIVSRLLSRAQAEGHTNVYVFTKPAYVPLFTSLGFHLVGRAPEAALLESDPRGIAAYTARLRALRREHGRGIAGVAVMNCNPLTRGHLYLIRQALREVSTLYVIPVSDDRQLFGYEERRAMLTEALRDLPGAVICPESDYLISRAAFPAYFLKEYSHVAKAQIELDCDIFNRHIAPALGAERRFVGTEPEDGLTGNYNELMHERLAIPLTEIPRLTLEDGRTVSASALRRALSEGKLSEALPMAAPGAVPYLLAQAARQALLDELALTPKPGLVQPGDCGAHSDMTPALMRRGIEALYPFFVRIAQTGRTRQTPAEAATALRAIGIEAEAAMLRATGGVNTHRGALFALGLTVAAAAQCYAEEDGRILPHSLRQRITGLAACFGPATGTHGAAVRRNHGVAGATETARGGYAALFDRWLPAYRSNNDAADTPPHHDDTASTSAHAAADTPTRHDTAAPFSRHRLLLSIMAELDDTNIYHRGGAEAARYVKRAAREALSQGLTAQRLRQLGDDFKARNLSPGGSADMLALTLLIDSLTPRKD